MVSRQTALALVGALQAAEGVTREFITDLNSVNFGNVTTAAFESFPGSLKNGQNSKAYIPFNKLAQYGLYFNGYNPGRFDGIYDSTTSSEIAAFQEFYCLTGIGLVNIGEVNVSTMKSLLTSKGDTERLAKTCDCATVLNRQQAMDLKNAGYTHVGRYLTGSVGEHYTSKFITFDEAKYIELSNIDGGDSFGDMLSDIALSVKSGNITFDVTPISAYAIEVSINVSSENLMPEDEETEASISVGLTFRITLNSNGNNRFDTEKVLGLVAVGAAVTVAVVVIIYFRTEISA